METSDCRYYSVIGTYKTLNDVADVLKSWWETVELDINICDVSFIYLRKKLIFDDFITDKLATKLVKEDKMKRLLSSHSGHLALVFYTRDKKNETVLLFGFITIDQYQSAKSIKLCDVHKEATEEVVFGYVDYQQMHMRQYKLDNNVSLVRPSSSSSWCTFYTNIKNVSVDLFDLRAYEWRLSLVLKMQKLIDKTTQDEAHILDQSVMSMLESSIDLDLSCKEGRDIDNSSYHLCKILTIYDKNLLKPLLCLERHLASYKLLKYYSSERYYNKLCVKNKFDVDIKNLKKSKPDDIASSIISRFKEKYPDKIAPKLIFSVPFNQYYYSSKNKDQLIQINNGYVHFTYIDFDKYLYGRIERDVKLHISTYSKKKFMKCYKKYKDNNNNFDKNNMLAYYQSLSPLALKNDEDIDLMEDQVIKPISGIITSITSNNLIKNNNEYSYKGSNNKMRKIESSGDYEIESLFPMCIQNMLERSTGRHLYYDERMIFLLFLFSLGWEYDAVCEYWKQMCDMANDTGSKEQSMNVFLSKNKYGVFVKYAYKSSSRYKQNGKSGCYLCTTIINKRVTKNGENTPICPYVNEYKSGTTDIEDFCRIKCMERLQFKTQNTLPTIYNIYTPLGYVKQSNYAMSRMSRKMSNNFENS